MFIDDAALYNGKVVDLRSKIAEVIDGLKDCNNFAGAVAIRRFEQARDISKIPQTQTWDSFLEGGKSTSVPDFVRIGFHEPFLICYSSGTTGMPKAIVHSAGGVMISYFKEGRIHEDLGPDTVALQYTTTGWIMYLTNVAILLFGGRTVLYDGSPFQPDASILVRTAAEQKVTKLGISPRWMHELAKNNLSPREMADLSSLRVVTSTGMVLSDQLFEWFYDKGFPSRVHLGNISGGTDIAGCFGILNPLTPVYVGGTQGPSLGLHVAIYDSLLPNGPGKEVEHGTHGELVAANAFPNIPCFFWGDKEPAATPGSKYHGAYFARFDNVWAHGDFCQIHPVTRNIYFLGRADGVLNPSGVRFGSAEIYGVIERYFADKVQDSVCVGQRRPQDSDESVMLFLLMKPGVKFTRELVNEIKSAITRDLSKRHVPRYIFETPEIPVCHFFFFLFLPFPFPLLLLFSFFSIFAGGGCPLNCHRNEKLHWENILLHADILFDSSSVSSRQLSTSKRSSCPSSRLFRARQSRPAVPWRTRRVWTITTSLPRLRIWLGPRRSCKTMGSRNLITPR